VLSELLGELVVAALIVASTYLLLAAYARRWQPDWTEPLARRRLAILAMLVLALLAAKVSEDVLAGESGPIDEVILLFLRAHLPGALTGVFRAVTFTGSSVFIYPAAGSVVLGLVWQHRRSDAWLIAISTGMGAIVVYLVKASVGRARPSLWATDWYWGSSFPSGHTLVVAAFATAVALCVGRCWPAHGPLAMWLAFVWIFLVALSRLVLGVHWPTDVLAAACIGAFLPLAIDLAQAGLRKKRRRPDSRTP
jgi:undecaprenyl-diphosphatase